MLKAKTEYRFEAEEQKSVYPKSSKNPREYM